MSLYFIITDHNWSNSCSSPDSMEYALIQLFNTISRFPIVNCDILILHKMWYINTNLNIQHSNLGLMFARSTILALTTCQLFGTTCQGRIHISLLNTFILFNLLSLYRIIFLTIKVDILVNGSVLYGFLVYSFCWTS